MKKIIVLNEMHPDEQPGAATIALDYALELSKIENVLYLTTSTGEKVQSTERLSVRYLKRKHQITLGGYAGEFLKVLFDFFGFFRAAYYCFKIRQERPESIWVHQIGNYIPRLTLLFLPVFAPVLMTVHDYGFIVPRKLYPKDISAVNLMDLSVKTKKADLSVANRLQKFLVNLAYRLRRSILKFYVRKIKVVCISQQQADIYRLFGYRVHAVIANGINLCTCSQEAGAVRTNSVLFLGRVNGKGLDRLLIGASDSGIELLLAGSQDLVDYVAKCAPKLNFKYLGRLNRSEVFMEMHRTSLVYLASTCFDVYPTVGLEAIRHGAIPIVSDTTGLRDLVNHIDPSLVLNANSLSVPLKQYFEMMQVKRDELEKNLWSVNNEIMTVTQSLNKYLSLMQTS